MKLLIIIRGLPGSGKTHLAKEIAQMYSKNTRDVYLASTDKFWATWDDSYNFQLKYIDLAHKWNQGVVAKCMFDQYGVIIVDNTNITFEEIAPYLDMAARFGYTVEVREPQTEWAKDVQECHKRSVHKVPLETIEKMAARWEDISISCVRKEY